MTWVRLSKLGTRGAFPDLHPSDIPAEGWNRAEGVRFIDGQVWQSPLPGAIMPAAAEPLTAIGLVPDQAGAYRLIGAGTTKIFRADPSNQTWLNVTGTATWAGQVSRTTVTHFSGQLILNDGSNAPAYLVDGETTTTAQPLPNWPTGWTASSLRSYREYLIALAPSENGVAYPTRIKWSDAALPGGIPATWDPTITSADAGEYELGEGWSQLVDGYQLRDRFFAYRTGDCWAMQWTGDQYVFDFRQAFKTVGLLARRCVFEHKGFHYVATADDLVMHDGQTVQTLLDRKARRAVFSRIDPTAYPVSTVSLNRRTSELIFAYPTTAALTADRAVIVNLQTGAVGELDLSAHQITDFTIGRLSTSGGGTWDTILSPWDTGTDAWSGGAGLGAYLDNLYLADASGAALRWDGNDAPGAYPILERVGMPATSDRRRATLRRVRLVGKPGPSFQPPSVQVAGMLREDEAPTWSPAKAADLSTGRAEVSFLVSGLFFGLRIVGGADWQLTAIELDLVPTGGY